MATDGRVTVPKLTPSGSTVDLDADQVTTGVSSSMQRQRVVGTGLPVLLWDGPGVTMPSGYSTAYPTWANNAAAGTIVTLDIPLPSVNYANAPATPQKDATYAIVVQNASTTTPIRISVQNKISFNGGTAVFANVDGASNPNASASAVGSGGTPLVVPAGDLVTFLVQGWMLGQAGRLVLSNDSTVTDGGTVTVGVQVWRL